MRQVSVFLLAQEIQGRQREGERCRRKKDVRTSNMVEKSRNFLDKDRRLYITTSVHFGVNVATIQRIIHEDVNVRKNLGKV